MQEFKVDKKYITAMKGCLVVFVTFIILGLALPLLSNGEKVNPTGTLVITILITVVFGFFSLLTWLTIKKLPNGDIAIDDEGIWYKHIGKDKGLISWCKILRVQERAYRQCLYLLDCNGEKLIRVEYQLTGFETIRHILNEKISSEPPVPSQTKFSKGPLYHQLHLASVLGFSALGFYVGSNGHPLLGYGGISILLVVLIYEYFVTATGIDIGIDHFKIVYPVINKYVLFSDIEDIRIEDMFHKGNRIPEVWLVSKKERCPFILKNLGTDSNIIYIALRTAAKHDQ